MLPDAFNLTHGGLQGDLVQFDFKPNSKFLSFQSRSPRRPRHGGLDVDEREDNRLAAIGGKLPQEMKFGGGFLGHLDKSDRFAFRQQETAPGPWDMT
jgi:hypothetical protein